MKKTILIKPLITEKVSVVSVNTAVMPGKAKSRNTKSGVVKGSTSSFKKAIVKLAEGETLDLYGEM